MKCCEKQMRKLTPLNGLVRDKVTEELYYCETCGRIRELACWLLDAEDEYNFMVTHGLTDVAGFDSLKLEFGGDE